MQRRQFLAAATGATLSAWVSPSSAEAQPAPPQAKPFAIDSPPVLQCPTTDGVTVAWAVTSHSDGWVEYGPTDTLGRTARSTDRGLVAYEPRFHTVRITGVTAGKPFYYRVAAAPVTFGGPYKIERGEAVRSEVYRCLLPKAASDTSSFAHINDTHEKVPVLQALLGQLAQGPADVTIWNGDVFNDIRSDDHLVQNVLRPAGAAYAAERPVLFSAGNHDHRGVAARSLPKAFVPWPESPDLPWCYAVRNGPVAIVGLDTGEDKPDHHPAWAGLAAFGPYRERQALWLEGVLKRPDIALAPYLVVCCHIPLVGLPGDNGGDTLDGFARYCRHASDLWSPLLSAAKACLVISGHTHRHRYDQPTTDRSFGQLVGGGPTLEGATVIRGVADAKALRVTASSAAGQELGAWTFAPRGQ